VRALPLRGLRLDATVFLNDYENQIVAASLAGGVGATLTNGGETLHEGLEIGARLDSAMLTGSRHNVFVRGAYTWLPVARFEGSRYSSVPGQGSVSVSGNRLPYAPEALLTRGASWPSSRPSTSASSSPTTSTAWRPPPTASAGSSRPTRSATSP
jgi:Fe(3+) dicitrate transport protein